MKRSAHAGPMWVSVRSWALCLFFLALPLAAEAAQCVSMEDLPQTPETVAMNAAMGRTASDVMGRVVVPVNVNGRGPYRFIVDTGANRSVLSAGLARELGLTPTGVGQVHSVHDVTPAPLVEVNSIEYSGITLPAQPVPLLEGPVLAGQQGLLGVDGMAGRRLHLDFVRRCIEIAPASSRAPPSWTTVRGELRFGHLIVLRGRIRGTEVNVLVDTGADVSLANVALRDALRARARPMPDQLALTRAYSAGEPVVLDDVVALSELNIGEMRVQDLIAYIGNFHIFNLWGLQDEPTILIGMDVLRRTRALSIDYSRATVSFRLAEPARYWRIAPTGTRLH